jgi:hypothetical protein
MTNLTFENEKEGQSNREELQTASEIKPKTSVAPHTTQTRALAPKQDRFSFGEKLRRKTNSSLKFGLKDEIPKTALGAAPAAFSKRDPARSLRLCEQSTPRKPE